MNELHEGTRRLTQVPIALFVYNRPEHADRALQALTKCDRFDECDLYIFCDGPRSDAGNEAVRKIMMTREVAQTWVTRCGATVVVQPQNLGLAQSIIQGVTSLCNQYGSVIVLEDDLVVSPDFLDFMIQGLDYYRDSKTVYQISGHMYPISHPLEPSALFLPYVSSWGWATWQRAWRNFDWNMTGAEELFTNQNMRYNFDLFGGYPYTDLLKRQWEVGIDTWDIQWYWTIFRARGLVLHPRRSLVWNGGFDGSGIHCGVGGLEQEPIESFYQRRLIHELVLPKKVVVDKVALRKIVKHLRRQWQTGLRARWLPGRLRPFARFVYKQLGRRLTARLGFISLG